MGEPKYRRTCAQCESAFLASRRHALFCSASCRAKASRNHRKTAAAPPVAVRINLSRTDAQHLRALVDRGSRDLDAVQSDAAIRLLDLLDQALDY